MNKASTLKDIKLRSLVRDLRASGMGATEIARSVGKSRPRVYQLIKEMSSPDYLKARTIPWVTVLRDWITGPGRSGEWSIPELAEILLKHGYRVPEQTIRSALARLGWSLRWVRKDILDGAGYGDSRYVAPAKPVEKIQVVEEVIGTGDFLLDDWMYVDDGEDSVSVSEGGDAVDEGDF